MSNFKIKHHFKRFDSICLLPSIPIFVLGLCLLFHPTAYIRHNSGLFFQMEYDFLQAGDYVLEATYSDLPSQSRLSIHSQTLVDENNRQGVILSEEVITETEGIVSMTFHLDTDTRSVIFSHDAGDDNAVFSQINLQSVRLMDRDNYFLGGCFILTAVFVLFFGRTLCDKKFRIPLLLLLIGFLASLPLMNDSLKVGHDIKFHLARIEGLYQGLRSGAFPVRINPIQAKGFGYLSSTMYPQLFLYPIAMLRFLRVSTMLCYKLLLFATSTATAFITYYSVKGITKSERIGLLSTVLYTFSAYRLNDLYTRAAIGEVLAMVFFPLVAWGIYEVFWGNSKKWYILALGVSATLQCHLLSTEMCLLFLVATGFLWLATGKRQGMAGRIGYCLIAAIMTLLWNMGLWLPILFFSGEGLQVYSLRSDVSLSSAYFSQMFTFFSEADGPNRLPGYTQGEMPLSVGGILLVCSILLVVSLAGKAKEEYTSSEKFALTCLYMGSFAVLLSSHAFPWQELQKIEWLSQTMSSLQFVWRFLAPASFFLCVAGSVGIVSFQERFVRANWLIPLLIVVQLCSTAYYFDRFSYCVDDMPDKMQITGIDDSSTPVFLYDESDLRDFSREQSTILCSNDSEITYSQFHKDGTFLSVNVLPERIEAGAKLIFPLYGYTGYQVLVNGVPVQWERMHSKIACDLPTEESLIEISFKGPPLFAVADAVSWISIIGTVLFFLVKRKKDMTRYPS